MTDNHCQYHQGDNLFTSRTLVMPHRSSLILLLCILPLAGCTTAPAEPPLSRIAFGSCCNQNREAPIWDSVVAAEPQLFLYIGDNIYGDTEDMNVLRAKYGKLGAMPGYQKLLATCPLMATWDDHDYGVNDGGEEYPKRVESQQVFLEFFNEPKDSARWSRPGVYDARIIGPKGKRVQVILLDTRYFRSPLKSIPKVERKKGVGYYLPDDREELTMLGDAQWKWLEGELKKPAEVRIIATSIQAVPEEHMWEYWATLPRERRRLFETIGKANASGAILISGDRHLSEISRLATADPANGAGYPLYDVTSSSLNQPSGGNENEANRHRIGSNYRKVNFGVIDIDWSKPDPVISMQVRDLEGMTVLEHSTVLSELKRPGGR